jgi:CubicO group peptidase (beta-lactamase class C family)
MNFISNLKFNYKIRLIGKYLEKYYEKEKIANLAFVLYKDEDQQIKKYLGYEDIEKKKELSDRSMFRWGSCSKLLTLAIAMRLRREGILDFNKDIRTYLSDFIIPQFINNDKTQQIPESTYNKLIINVIDLLSHKSCLETKSHRIKELKFDKKVFYNQRMIPKPNSFIDFMNVSDKILELSKLPGSMQIFSNYNYFLIAKICVLTSGKTWLKLVKEYIKKDDVNILPSLFLDNGPLYGYAKFKNKEHEYYRCKGYLKREIKNDESDIGMIGPSEGYMSNIDDAITFFKDLTNKETYLNTSEKNECLILDETRTENLGLGFCVYNKDNEKTYNIGHYGYTINCRAVMKYYLKNKISFVILSSDEHADMPHLSGYIEKMLFL